MLNITQLSEQVHVTVEPYFIEQRLLDNQELYIFGYHVTIKNNSSQSVQLLRRHWVITDSNGQQSEVEGVGVVGPQPIIKPNSEFKYSSGSTFKTPVGTMHGQYTMVSNEEQRFNVSIEPFRLADNKMIH